MRTGVALSVLRNEVKLEAGESNNASHGTQRDAFINQYLNRVQRGLAQEFHWPTLHTEVDHPLTAGTKIYTLNATLDPAKIEEVWASIGNQWVAIAHTVGRLERSAFDADERSYPPSRFELQPDDGSGIHTFEVWPIPSDAGTIRISGQKVIADMSADNHVCLIDADVLVLVTAGEILARNNQADAAYKRNQGRQKARMILGALGDDIRPRITHGRKRRPLRPYEDYIPPEG